ncbi:MAG: IS66 family transposase, partial [Verrucomicrobia bacterium]|nr:IS66 family transposase [Verrucomicrobiota bacterium]
QRAACRQAAPFRLAAHRRAQAPKRPGRRPGHPGACRPRPTRIDQDITVELGPCPHCGGTQFAEPTVCEQFIEDIPEVRPHVTRLRTYEATCTHCQRTVRSRHPLQVSLATGAAGSHLGPHALALAADLNKAKGLSMRNTCAVLRDDFGLVLTPGGLAQALGRLAVKLQPQYQAIGAELRCTAAVHSDETSWWVGGPGWWLWVYTHAAATYYVVAQSRGRAIVHAVLGSDYAGVLVSDCLAVYDGATPHQQKCYSHHHKAVREAKERHPALGEGYLCAVQALLRAATALKTAQPELDAARCAEQRQALEKTAATLLETPRSEPSEEAVRLRLSKQRDHLFTFLDHPAVAATNNLAERQLRPAVIARKISCGNKTPAGAHTWEILASVAATCTQRATSFIATVARAARLDSG